ncbi:hypothetical protein [Metakosakonia massiliensis]|uniref:hypothetical protein n=1 Tax=Phytobacter massiliensis TaxID=1485952 RepID=UPI000693FE9E|nr:hypothetical protein [Phytobacter massiliensis]
MGRREKGRRSKAGNVHVPSDTFILKRSDRIIYFAGQHPKNSAALLLVTRDNFLSLGITAAFYPLYNITHLTSLYEAWQFKQRVKVSKIIIDIASLAEPVLDEINTLRQLTCNEGTTGIVLLTEQYDRQVLLFLEKALPVRQTNKSESISLMRKNILTSPQHPSAISATLNKCEWTLIFSLSRGLSLKEIACQSNQPYHCVMYRLKMILQKLQLSGRPALMHLIQRLTNQYPS